MPPADDEQLQLVHRSIAGLQRLTELFAERREQLARSVGLTEQQWRVLEEISTEHFIPSMFARTQSSSAAAVSKILRQLLDKDLVRVSVSADDGRQRAYELSPAGRRAMARLRALRQDAIDAVWADLPRAELERFHRMSTELVTRIEQYAARERTRAGTESRETSRNAKTKQQTE